MGDGHSVPMNSARVSRYLIILCFGLLHYYSSSNALYFLVVIHVHVPSNFSSYSSLSDANVNVITHAKVVLVSVSNREFNCEYDLVLYL